jgi:hypothetical protein
LLFNNFPSAYRQANQVSAVGADPNPDNRKNGHKNTKENSLLNFIFVFWCLGGENVLPQNA